MSYWTSVNHLHCLAVQSSPQDYTSPHQASSYVPLIFSYIRIPKHTLGQCTLPNKFFTHPTLLALMCNLGAHGVLPEGNTATVCLCVPVCVSEGVRWPVSSPGPLRVPIRRPRAARSFLIRCWWNFGFSVLIFLLLFILFQCPFYHFLYIYLPCVQWE